MAKQYKIITDDETREDFQKTIEVSEETTTTSKTKTSVAQLKVEYEECQERIRSMAKRADEIVAELEGIRDNVAIEKVPIPDRMQDTKNDRITVPLTKQEEDLTPVVR